MAWLQEMNAVLVAEIPAAGEFAAAARQWLTEIPEQVFPGLCEGLRRHPVVRTGPLPADGTPWGEPGQTLGSLGINREHPLIGRRTATYSDRARQRFLEVLDQYPFAASFSMQPIGDRGFPDYPDEAFTRVAREPDAPAWTVFSFTAPAVYTGWPDSPELQDRWAGHVREHAVRLGACAGGMTDDIDPGQTALQRALIDHEAQVADSRKVLRSYSWVTVLAPGLSVRLGGIGVLRSSGAFCEVSPLPGGAVWLRATPAVNEFTGDRVRKVFEVLAPVLMTGVPRFRGRESFRIVEGVDAAGYQSASPGL